jgi:3-oxoadipate enol-lactonase
MAFMADELQTDPPPAVHCLGEITAPTLVVVGDRDLDVVAAIGDVLADGVPGARKVTLAGADHLLPLRVPGRLHDVLAEHLSR